MRNTTFDKGFSPMSGAENAKSFSILNYNKGKSSRRDEDSMKQDDSPKRLFPAQQSSAERRGGLVPLNKVMNKSQSSTMLRKAGTMVLPRTHTENDESQNTNTTLDKSISKTYYGDLRLAARSTSKNRETSKFWEYMKYLLGIRN